MDDSNRTSEDFIKEIEGLISYIEAEGGSGVEDEAREEKRSQGRELFRSFIECTPNVILYLSPDHRVLEFNPEAERLYGRRKEDVLGKDYFEFFLPETARNSVAADIEKVLAGEPTKWFENTVIAGDGQERLLRWSVGRVLDPEGKATGVVAVGQDITEQRAAEAELSSSEERLKILFESAPDGIFLCDFEGIFVDGNRAAEELVGYERGELIGKSFADSGLVSSEELRRAIESLKKNADGEATAPGEFTLLRKDGSSVPVEIRTYPVMIDGRVLSLGVARDITLRKRAEEALVESREQYRTLVEDTEQGITLIKDGRLVFANHAAEKMLGYSFEELSSFSSEELTALIHSEDRRRVAEHMTKRLAGEASPEELEYRVVHKDGEVRWLSVTATVTGYDGGYTIQTYNTDITQRKLAEHTLDQSEKTARALLAATADMGLLIDRQGRVIDLNEAMAKALGGNREDMMGAVVYDYLPADLAEQRMGKGLEAERTGKSVRFEDQRAGRWLENNVYPVFDAEGKATRFAIYSRDITAQKEAARVLKESEERFRSLVEHTSDAVLCYEYDPPISTSLPLEKQVELLYPGRVVECNLVAARYYGCDCVKDVLGKRFSELLSVSPDDSVDELLSLFIRGGYHVVEGETLDRDSNGSKRYYSINAHGVISDENLVRAWVTFHEITERKEAAEALLESEERFRALFELSPYSAAYNDLEGNIVACNEQFVKLHACRGGTEAQVGRNVSDFLPEEEKPLMLSTIRKTIESRESQGPVEYTMLREDGTRFPGEVTCSVIAGQDGEPKGLFGLAHDITERKQAEDAIKESEQRFRVLAEKSPNMIFINVGGRVVYVNEKCEEIMGYRRDEFYEEGFDFLTLIAPKDRELVKQKFSMHIAGQEVETYDYSLISKRGQRIDVIIATKLIEYRGEKAILGIVTDITERKLAEEALAHSEEKYRGFIENFLGIVYQSENLSFKPNFFHGAVEEMTGYKEEDFTSAVITWDELIDPEDFADVRKKAARLQASADYTGDSEYRVRRRDGEIRWVRDTARRLRIDDSDLVQGVIYDITERKKTEDALGDVLKMSDDIVQTIPAGLFIYKYEAPDSLVLVHGNPEAERLTGLNIADSIGKDFDDLWPTAREKGLTDKFLAPMKTGEIYQTEDLFYRDERLEGAFRIRAFRLPGDKLAVAFENIMERKRAEQELRKSEEHYRMLAETMNEGLAHLAEDGTYVYVNKKHCEIFGCSPDEMIGEHWTKFYTGDARKTIESQFAGRKKGLARPYEVAISREDGREVHLLISPQAIFDEEGDFKGSLSILTDITDRKKAEEKARRHQSELAHVWRVNTMGEMASGLAHELNQPLCAILNYANACLRIMKTRTDITEEMTESVKQVASQADRAGQIIKRIRSLVAKRKPQTSAVDINYIVREVVELERGEASKMEVTVRTKLGEDLPHVLADSVEIEEVILNLVRNAFDAMTDPIVEQREVTIITRKTKGRFVEVCVKDTGKGFAALGQQIFDSFFTTKPDGLGIGLSISRTIVELHGGKLWAEENRDCGASFKFTLPAKRG